MQGKPGDLGVQGPVGPKGERGERVSILEAPYYCVTEVYKCVHVTGISRVL